MNEVLNFTADSEASDSYFSKNERKAFFEGHFLELAVRHNEKWLNRIKQMVRLGKDFDEHAAVRKVAEAEKIEFEARKTKEFEKWREPLLKVFEELAFVKENPEEAERQGKRPLLLVMGGGMKGPYCAGQVVGLHDMGFGNVFKNVVGVSAGSGPAAFFVAGPEQARNATSLFGKDCCVEGPEGLVHLSPREDGKRKIVDTGVIARKMRSGEKALDQEAILNSDTGLYAVATNAETGEVEFINAKTATREGELDMVAACEASSAIPLFEDSFEVNGQQYLDGSLGEFPFDKLIKDFNPTSILVLPNMAFSELDLSENTTLEHMVLWFAKLFGKEGSLGAGQLIEADPTASLKKASSIAQTLGMMLNNKETYEDIQEIIEGNIIGAKEKAREAIEAIEQVTDVNIGVLWAPRSGLSNLTNHASTVQAAMIDAYHDLFTQLGETEPDKVKYWN